MPDFEFIVHAAGIASPTYYRAHRWRRWTPTSTGCAMLLEYARDRVERGHEVARLPLLLQQRDLWRSRSRTASPRPEDYRGNVSCTGPRACYDESKRYGETLCVVFAAALRRAGADGPAVQQLRTGTQDHRSTRDPRLRTRRLQRSRHRHALRWKPEADLLLRRRRRRRLLQGARARAGAGEPYNIGIDRPEISMADLGRRLAAHGARALRLHRDGSARASRPRLTIWSTTRTAGARTSTKSRTELGYEPSILIDEGLRRSLVWYHYHRQAEDA